MKTSVSDPFDGTFEPDTSSGLIRAVGTDMDSERWQEFVSLYTPLMRLWLCDLAKAHVSLRPELFDDIIQETLLQLMKSFPGFTYDRTKGHFRGYLRRMLHNFAMKAAERDLDHHRLVSIDSDGMEMAPAVAWPDARDADGVSPEMVQAFWNILLERVFSEGDFSSQSQAIFRKLVSGEMGVAELAEAYSMKPNAIYQLKSRVINSIKRRKQALERKCDTLLDYLEKLAGDDLP